MRNLCNNKKVSKLPHLSNFVDDLSHQLCKKHISDSHIVLKSDLSCETYLTTQMVAHTVTSQNNLKNLLHLTGSAEMKKVSKFPTCQSYPALPYIELDGGRQEGREGVRKDGGREQGEGVRKR